MIMLLAGCHDKALETSEVKLSASGMSWNFT